MELNREEIKKAMECCITKHHENCCNLGKWHEEWNCMTDLMGKALALINEQEQKIFELENRLAECENGYEGTLALERAKIKELTEENEGLKLDNKILKAEKEKLQIICNSYAFQYGTVVDKEVFLKKERTDTVQYMVSEIKKRCIKGGVYPAFVAETIDQVAKELIGK